MIRPKQNWKIYIGNACISWNRSQQGIIINRIWKKKQMNKETIKQNTKNLQVELNKLTDNKNILDTVLNSLPGIFYMFNQKGKFVSKIFLNYYLRSFIILICLIYNMQRLYSLKIFILFIKLISITIFIF